VAHIHQELEPERKGGGGKGGKEGEKKDAYTSFNSLSHTEAEGRSGEVEGRKRKKKKTAVLSSLTAPSSHDHGMADVAIGCEREEGGRRERKKRGGNK